MGKKSFCAFFVLFLVLGFFGSLHAQQTQWPATSAGRAYSPADPSSYFVLKGGAFWPKGDLNNLGTGFNGEFAYGGGS